MNIIIEIRGFEIYVTCKLAFSADISVVSRNINHLQTGLKPCMQQQADAQSCSSID